MFRRAPDHARKATRGHPNSRQGRRASVRTLHHEWIELSLRTVAGRNEKTTTALCAEAHGFSLHAGERCGAHQRKELERLCRYITRPAIANERVKRDGSGDVVLQLKSAWRDGTTHIRMSPLEFMQRLAGDIVADSQKRRLNFLFAPHAGEAAVSWLQESIKLRHQSESQSDAARVLRFLCQRRK